MSSDLDRVALDYLREHHVVPRDQIPTRREQIAREIERLQQVKAKAEAAFLAAVRAPTPVDEAERMAILRPLGKAHKDAQAALLAFIDKTLAEGQS